MTFLTKQNATVLLTFLALTPQLGLACLCTSLDLDESYAHADYVVVANLMSAEILDDTFSKGVFEVSEILKGNPPKLLKLKTRYQTGHTCGVIYWVGASYVLFLQSNQEVISSCSGNGPMSLRKDVFEWYVNRKNAE